MKSLRDDAKEAGLMKSFLKIGARTRRCGGNNEPSVRVYEVRPRIDKRGVDLISDLLPVSPLWYTGPNAVRNAIGFAKFHSQSHQAVIRVYDDAGNVIETHEHHGEFKEP